MRNLFNQEFFKLTLEFFGVLVLGYIGLIAVGIYEELKSDQLQAGDSVTAVGSLEERR